MDNREWIYTGRPSQAGITREWMDKTEEFLEHAFKEANGAKDTFCPCNECQNKKIRTREFMIKDLCKHGFMPNYTRWVHHGEAYRPREEVMRRRLQAFDDEGGVPEWLGDYEDAMLPERPTEHEQEDKQEEPQPTEMWLLAFVQTFLLQHQSGAASNHVEGSPASHVGPSAPGPSPGSNARASLPSPASHVGPSP